MFEFKNCCQLFVIFIACFFAASAQANSADEKLNPASCIEIGRISSKLGPQYATQTLKNTCSQDVTVIWCHSPSSYQGTQRTECNYGRHYYQQRTTLNPGGTKENYLSMPEDSTIHFAACFGDIDNIKQATNGEFLCKPPRIATDDTKTFISTASAPTKAEACKKAKAMAANDKGSGECTCQTRGKISICRVESTGPKPASSVIDSAKKEIRERAKCKSDDKDCIPANKIHNAGPGVNG